MFTYYNTLFFSIRYSPSMRIFIILLFGLFVSSSVFAEDATVKMLNKLGKENKVFQLKLSKLMLVILLFGRLQIEVTMLNLL